MPNQTQITLEGRGSIAAHQKENLRPDEAANFLGVSVSTLAKLRMRHKRANGPKYIKLSGCVIYRRDDLDAWLNSNVVEA